MHLFHDFLKEIYIFLRSFERTLYIFKIFWLSFSSVVLDKNCNFFPVNNCQNRFFSTIKSKLVIFLCQIFRLTTDIYIYIFILFLSETKHLKFLENSEQNYFIFLCSEESPIWSANFWTNFYPVMLLDLKNPGYPGTRISKILGPFFFLQKRVPH